MSAGTGSGSGRCCPATAGSGACPGRYSPPVATACPSSAPEQQFSARAPFYFVTYDKHIFLWVRQSTMSTRLTWLILFLVSGIKLNKYKYDI